VEALCGEGAWYIVLFCNYMVYHSFLLVYMVYDSFTHKLKAVSSISLA
jgi:hypothetical protein